jgi:hypothetical protein
MRKKSWPVNDKNANYPYENMLGREIIYLPQLTLLPHFPILFDTTQLDQPDPPNLPNQIAHTDRMLLRPNLTNVIDLTHPCGSCVTQATFHTLLTHFTT